MSSKETETRGAWLVQEEQVVRVVPAVPAAQAAIPPPHQASAPHPPQRLLCPPHQ